MKAVDTNVVVRLITGDDSLQTPLAIALVETQPVFVSLSVVMETEGVLRSAYRWSRERIADALDALVRVENVWIEEVAWVIWSIQRMRDGADLADMIHLLAARQTQAFVTFDRALASVAGPDGPLTIETLA